MFKKELYVRNESNLRCETRFSCKAANLAAQESGEILFKIQTTIIQIQEGSSMVHKGK
jgi:hypothetical protein